MLNAAAEMFGEVERSAQDGFRQMRWLGFAGHISRALEFAKQSRGRRYEAKMAALALAFVLPEFADDIVRPASGSRRCLEKSGARIGAGVTGDTAAAIAAVWFLRRRDRTAMRALFEAAADKPGFQHTLLALLGANNFEPLCEDMGAAHLLAPSP